MLKHRCAIVLLLLTIAGCNKSSESDANPAAVTAAVRTEPVGRIAMQTTLGAYGTVNFSPELLRTVDTAAEIRVEKILVAAGESLRAGQVLLIVQPTANASLELQRAGNDLKFTEQVLRRTQGLRQQQLATNLELAVARQANDNARVTLSSISARMGDTRTGEIRADRDGFVASVDVQRGAIVPAGMSLLHLADRANLRLQLGIEPSDLPQVREGQSVKATAVYDDKVAATGRIVKLVRQVDPQTRLAAALVDIDATTGLLPGSTVKAEITLERRDGVLAVPRSAVLYDGTRPYLYLVAGDKAKQVWATLGQDDGRTVEILSGVNAGDQVVVEGNYELQDGMAVKTNVASP